jgi:hypothetical protein
MKAIGENLAISGGRKGVKLIPAQDRRKSAAPNAISIPPIIFCMFPFLLPYIYINIITYKGLIVLNLRIKKTKILPKECW